MSFLICLMIGTMTGWFAVVLLGTGIGQSLLLNVVIGNVGAVLGGFLFSGLSGTWSMDPHAFGVGGVLMSLLCAAILLVLARLARVTV